MTFDDIDRLDDTERQSERMSLSHRLWLGLAGQTG